MKKNNAGFTLIEVLASMGLFAIFATMTATAFIGNIKFNHESELKSEAIQAAQQVMDDYRTQDPTLLPTSGTVTRTITIGARSYTVVTTFCPSGSTYCTSVNLRHLKNTVSKSGQILYEVESIFSQLQ